MSEQMSVKERARTLAMQAMNRGLWTWTTATAFVDQVTEAELVSWEKALADLDRTERDAKVAEQRLDRAEELAENAYDAVRAAQNVLRSARYS